jgi:uncharacterized coiled-coil DUF342 family protein
MDMLKEELNQEFSRIKEKLEKGSTLSEEDLKIILLSMLSEEDLHESKQ